MLKPLSRPLLVLALIAPLPVLAQQGDAARQKELDAARADLQRAAKRVAELSRDEAGRPRTPVNVDPLVVRRPRLGVLLSGDEAPGVRVTGVTPESGAAKAGLKAGDRLLRVAGEPVRGDTADARVSHARRLLGGLKAGTAVRIAYQRDGKTHEVPVTPTQVSPHLAFIGDGPRSLLFRSGDGGAARIDGVPVPPAPIANVISPEVQRELRQLGRLGECRGEECQWPALAEAFRWSGLNLATVDASLGRYFGTDTGVLVLSVGDGLAGLQAGDVILKMDGTAVTTPRDVTQALRGKQEDAKIAIEYLRDRQARTESMTVPKAAALRFPATPRVTIAPRTAGVAGQAPTVVERRRVMVIDLEGKVQVLEDEGGNAPPPPAPPMPASPAGKGSAVI